MSLPRHAFWFSRSTRQAVIEILLIGGGIWLSILLFQISHHLIASGYNQLELNFWINLPCFSWFVLRIKRVDKILSMEMFFAILLFTAIAIILYVFYMISMYYLFLSSPNIPAENIHELFSIIVVSVGASLGWQVFFTGIVYLLPLWNRLRQQSLHWNLIHTHIMGMLVLMGSSMLCLLFSHPLSPLNIQFLSEIFVILLLFIILSFIALIFILPPLIILAYFATRSTINRIASLVGVTNELREGKYTVRAPIKGKDEIAQLQKNFNAMADELEKTIRDLQTERDHVASLLSERRELFANVSHELRTPIATLRGYLESNLQNRPHIQEATLWEDIAVMEREVLQLQERADELFILSKAEVGQETLTKSPCDIQQLIQLLVDSYAPLAWRTNKIEIIAEMPDEVPLISANEQRLEQALKNIVRNALRHTPPGGVIALIVTTEAERVGIAVEDTGEGIAPEELEHIWERFYQAKTAQKQDGAGIGLSLVKEWITDMGGSVAAMSTLGEGSTFTLYLPHYH